MDANVADVIGLGLESSCDETAAAIVLNGKKILSNVIFSQIDLHKEYNGVVPEIASRAHLEVINDIIETAMNEANISFSRLNYVAATNRPGLIGSLLIALQSAKAISACMNIPLIAVNHLEAHLYAPFLEGYELFFPYIGLLVSGGNTAIYEITGINQMECLCGTIDDAVGEAFDKVSKYIGLGYPGGPAIEKLAATVDNAELIFPKILPLPNDKRFSYSGIKTAVVNYVKENPQADKAKIVYAFQERALEVLVRKVFAVARQRSCKRIVVAGGVAANGRLRKMLAEVCTNDEKLIIASPALCTDNGAMIAGIGYQYFMKGDIDSLDTDVMSKLPERTDAGNFFQ